MDSPEDDCVGVLVYLRRVNARDDVVRSSPLQTLQQDSHQLLHDSQRDSRTIIIVINLV
jgi:hypothetical protein